MQGRLNGKVALVTGGSSGIGRAISLRLAAEGAHVVVADIQASLGHGVSEEINGTFVELDISREDQWVSGLGEVTRRLGGIDVLVNNAAMPEPTPIGPEQQDWNSWEKILSVNVKGVVLGCKLAIPILSKSAGGSIVNISSAASDMATPFYMAYGASKSGVRHITRSVAQYCAKQKNGIRCNSVHPGPIRTPIYAEMARESGLSMDALFARVVNELRVPLGRMGEPADIAAAVAFLASDDSSYLTGCRLNVDGGLVDCV